MNDPRYVPSLAELKKRAALPFGASVTELPGGTYVLDITEVEEKIRVAYVAELDRLRTQLKVTEAELELVQKQRDLATTAQAITETRLRAFSDGARTVWAKHEKQFAEQNEELEKLRLCLPGRAENEGQ